MPLLTASSDWLLKGEGRGDAWAGVAVSIGRRTRMLSRTAIMLSSAFEVRSNIVVPFIVLSSRGA